MSYLRWGLIAGMLLLSGCASLPSPTETNGGMLAFPMHVSSDAGGRFYYTYEFQVFRTGEEGIVDRIILDPTLSKRVETFGPYPVGNYYLGVQTTWPKESQTLKFSYNPRPRRVFYAFTIEEDSITVLNNILMVHKRLDRRTQAQVWSLNQEGQDEAVAQLLEDEQASQWHIKARYPIAE